MAGNSVQILARSASRPSKERNSPRASPVGHVRCLTWAALRLRSRARPWGPTPGRYRLFWQRRHTVGSGPGSQSDRPEITLQDWSDHRGSRNSRDGPERGHRILLGRSCDRERAVGGQNEYRPDEHLESREADHVPLIKERAAPDPRDPGPGDHSRRVKDDNDDEP